MSVGSKSGLDTLSMFVTVGSALSMRPGLGCMLAFSAVFSFGAYSLSSDLWKYNQRENKSLYTLNLVQTFG